MERALVEQAAEWVVRLAEHDPPDEALRRDCDAWCAADARHAAALRSLQRTWAAAAPVPPPASASKRRRGLTGGVLAVLFAIVAISAWPLRDGFADERSAVGETRRIALADGSMLTLNTDSAVAIDFGPTQRSVRLLRGEVFAEVAHEAAMRPFRIVTRDGEVTALGTQYAVRRDAQDSAVSVIESQVEVHAAGAAAPALPLAAGYGTRFDAQRVQPPHALAMNTLGWRRGLLVFEDAPVTEVLRELARYRSGLLLADDETLRSLRFTGVLPSGDAEEALALLNDALPLHVVRITRYAVRVTRRGGVQ